MKQTNLTRDHSDAVTRGLVAATAARSYSWVEELANDSGDDITEGAVVVVLSDGTIQLADVENDPRPTGVALDDIDDGNSGQVCFGGPVDLVQVVASVTAGDYGQTSTTLGEAQVAGSVAKAFCEFTDSGTTPSAFLWGGRGGGGTVAGIVVEDFDTSETDTSLVLHPDGTGGIEWGVDATGGGSGDFLTRRGGELAVVSTTLASGAALTLDLSAANLFDITLTANCTIAFSNPPISGVLAEWTIILRQDATGSRTVTWPGSVNWQNNATGVSGGSAPTLYTTAAAEDVIVLTTLDGGTTYGGGQERAGASFGTPAIVLGTAAAAGSAATAVRTDATIVAFDATVPSDVAAVGVASSTGSVAKAARRDHGHALTYHDEPLTDGASNFIFDGGDVVVVTGVPN